MLNNNNYGFVYGINIRCVNTVIEQNAHVQLCIVYFKSELGYSKNVVQTYRITLLTCIVSSLLVITTSCILVHLLVNSFSASCLASVASAVTGSCFTLVLLLLLLLPLLSPTGVVELGGDSMFDIRDAFIFFLEVVLRTPPIFLLDVLGGGGSISIMAVLSDSGRLGQRQLFVLPDSFEGMSLVTASPVLLLSSAPSEVPCCWLMCSFINFSTGGLLLCLSPNSQRSDAHA